MAERVCVMDTKGDPNVIQHISSDRTEVIMNATVGGYGAATTKTFTFDSVFPPDGAQSDLFTDVGIPLVDAALQGFNGTVLAYGQTGSGKTHTMMGPDGGVADGFTSEQRGLVPRIMDEMFRRLKMVGCEVEWTVTASMFEIYNEVLYDLGMPTTTPTSLQIREDRATGRGVYVEGLQTVSVADTTTFVGFMQTCSRNKHIARTNSNETSSRSHTIVQVSIVQQNNVYGGTRTSSNVFLVDLAGSERIDKTGAEGQRLKEAQSINLSLTLLGNVIYKLTDPASLHIPYRDSKLTRILQDSLGGNSRTTLLCMCSGMAANHSETMSTLAFATRAKSIQNRPRANKELSGDELKKAYAAAVEEIRLLTERVGGLEGGQMVGCMRVSVKPSTSSEDTQSLLREIEQLKMEGLAAQREMGSMQDRIGYHTKREAEFTAKASEWKAKYEREKMAGDSWMRKFEEMQKATKPTPPVVTRPKASAGSVQKGPKKPMLGPTPATPTEEALVGLATPRVELTEDLEIRFAVKEKGYLQQIEDLEGKRTEFAKASIILERLVTERDNERKKFNDDIDATVAKYESLLTSQDKEIGALQLKLDERVTATQTRQFGMLGDMERLTKENDTLHEENRANALRLLDFAKRLEKQVKEIETLHNERVRLMREIEESSLSAEVKAKMLGGKIRAEQKSLFQRKLLDCFAQGRE